MNSIGTPRDQNKKPSSLQKRPILTCRSRAGPGLFGLDDEAQNIFDQVQANKHRILKKGSENAYYTKTTVKTIKFDANGKETIEKFESTAFGGFNNEGEKVGEISQQYCNNTTGIEKVSVQRILGNKLKRVERKKTFDCFAVNEFLENTEGDFDSEWKEKAKNFGARKVVGFEKKLSGLKPFDDL